MGYISRKKLLTWLHSNFALSFFPGFPRLFAYLRSYHFTWSCDDTGSPEYHVNYGVSDSITGPIEFKYTVLEKRPELDILGTGHHCILQIPGEDEYYIAYHRFFTPLDRFTDGKGFHREVCIDRLYFGEDGQMTKVIPTVEGVQERILSKK